MSCRWLDFLDKWCDFEVHFGFCCHVAFQIKIRSVAYKQEYKDLSKDQSVTDIHVQWTNAQLLCHYFFNKFGAVLFLNFLYVHDFL